MVTQLQPDVRAYLHGGEVIKRYIRVEEVAHEYGFSVEETEYIAKTGETTAIGKFHGFELLVEKNFLDINYMVLRGKTEYKAELSTSPVGSMVKLENLFNGLHENIDFLEKKIEQYQNDLEASKSEYDKPFAYSMELEEKLARQCELNAQLDLENAKVMAAY